MAKFSRRAAKELIGADDIGAAAVTADLRRLLLVAPDPVRSAADVAAMTAAFEPPHTRSITRLFGSFRRRLLRAAGFTGLAVTVAFSGAAFAGALPSGLQRDVAHFVKHLGVSLPGSGPAVAPQTPRVAPTVSSSTTSTTRPHPTTTTTVPHPRRHPHPHPTTTTTTPSPLPPPAPPDPTTTTTTPNRVVGCNGQERITSVTAVLLDSGTEVEVTAMMNENVGVAGMSAEIGTWKSHGITYSGSLDLPHVSPMTYQGTYDAGTAVPVGDQVVVAICGVSATTTAQG